MKISFFISICAAITLMGCKSSSNTFTGFGFVNKESTQFHSNQNANTVNADIVSNNSHPGTDNVSSRNLVNNLETIADENHSRKQFIANRGAKMIAFSPLVFKGISSPKFNSQTKQITSYSDDEKYKKLQIAASVFYWIAIAISFLALITWSSKWLIICAIPLAIGFILSLCCLGHITKDFVWLMTFLSGLGLTFLYLKFGHGSGGNLFFIP